MCSRFHRLRAVHFLRSFAQLGAIGLLAIVTGCSFDGSPSTAISSSPSPTPTTTVQSTPRPTAVVSPKPVKHHPKAIAWNDQGVKKLSQRDYKAALRAFNQAIRLDAKLAEAYFGRGITYAALRQRRAAFQDYNRAIKLDTTLAEAYFNRADEYAAMGKSKQAIADFDKAAQLFAQRGDQANVQEAQTRSTALQPAPVTATVPSPRTAPPVARSNTAPATPSMSLAMHLRERGAKMYGTFWCSVCNWQRAQFGTEAFNQITYVECDPNGNNPQPNLCDQVNIRAYPTWEINGRLYEPGGLSLGELADLSGYQGSRNF